MIHMLSDAAIYRNFLLSGALHCPGWASQVGYEDFAAAYETHGFLEPRRPAHIPIAKDNEVDLLMHIPRLPSVGVKGSKVESQSKIRNGAKVFIRGFPCGTLQMNDADCVSIFVAVRPAHDAPRADWRLTRRYRISLLPWVPEREIYSLRETFEFSGRNDDRGWHDFGRP